jgi:haloalkane dehalogenase
LPRLGLRWQGYRKVRARVRKKLNERLRELGLPDIATYRDCLEAHPQEWAVLDALCRISVSRFHRDRGVFDQFRRVVRLVHLKESTNRTTSLSKYCTCMADRAGKPSTLGSHPATRSRTDGDKRIAISKPWPHFAAWQVRHECLGRCYFAAARAHSAEGEGNMISAAFPYQKQRRRVLGSEMAYVEVGEGDPIVLLHGNPTSSYLCRNVLPHLEERGRCIAPDLIRMGDSDKLSDSGPGSYRFVEHPRYVDALLEALDVLERVTFVVHDWGSALGFDWANRHRKAVKGIAFMEAIVAPQGRDLRDKMGMRPALEALRTEAGEAMFLQNNYFIEEILPNAILRKLSNEEMAEYRRPFAEPGEGRRPTLTWPREIPIEGEPADVHAIPAEYADWLGTSNVPKLFLKVEPGAILANERLVNLVRGWPAVTEK